MAGNDSPGAANNFGYQTDYKKRSQMISLAHHTGGDWDPLHYTEADTAGGSLWTEAPKAGAPDNVRDTIDVIYHRIRALSADDARRAAAAWGALHDNLHDLIAVIGATTEKLQGGSGNWQAWRSPAADAFFAKGPGAAMKSLADWAEAALANQAALKSLADVIDDYKQRNENLYRDYQAALASAEQAWNEYWSKQGRDGKQDMTNHLGSQDRFNRNWFVDTMKKFRAGAQPSRDDIMYNMPESWVLSLGGGTNWNKEAQNLQYKMAQEFVGPISQLHTEGRSTRYEGPTDAVTVDQQTLARVIGNSLAAGLPGAPTAPAFSVPALDVPLFPTVPAPRNPAAPSDLPAALDPGQAPDAGNLGAPGSLGGLPDPTGLAGPLDALLPGVPRLSGDDAKDAKNLAGVVPSVIPPVMPGLAGLGDVHRPPALPGGLLNGPGAGLGAPAPPSSPSRQKNDRDNRPGLHGGVLGRHIPGVPEFGAEEGSLNSGLPAPPGLGAGPKRAVTDPRLPPAVGTTDAFTSAAASAPPAPSVLGRRQDRADRVDRPSGIGPEAFTAQVYVPPGATRPVVGAPRSTDPTAGVPASPAAGGSKRTARSGAGPTGHPPVPAGSDWLTQPEADAPPATAPVLDASARSGSTERAGGAWNDNFVALPTQPGATAPVLGRSAQSRSTVGGHVPAGRTGLRATGPDLTARRRNVADPVAVPVVEENVPAPIADEEAFSVETPGGAVLGGNPRGTAHEVAPKPTLGAG